MFSMQEMVIIGLLAVVLFGKRLPEVARTLGKHYGEFKRGISGFQNTFNQAMNETDKPAPKKTYRSYDDYEDYDQPTAPRFALPENEPKSDN